MSALPIKVSRNELDKTTNGCERRSQLMRDDRDKFVFDLTCLFQRGNVVKPSDDRHNRTVGLANWCRACQNGNISAVGTASEELHSRGDLPGAKRCHDRSLIDRAK